MLDRRKSIIDGDGIFTDKSISKGEVFYQIPINIVSSKPKAKCARIGDKYICDERVLNYINHSCDPNAKIDLKNLCLVSTRDIAPFEEITVDYNKTENDGELTHCNCRRKGCKGFFKRELPRIDC